MRIRGGMCFSLGVESLNISTSACVRRLFQAMTPALLRIGE